MAQTQNITSRSIVGNISLNRFLAMAGITGPILLVIADIIAGFSAPDYNYIQDSISSLAWTRSGWVQTIGFLAIGLLIELFVAGLFFTIRGVRGFGFGIIILVLFGFGLLVIGAFHTDAIGGPHTIEGTIHGWTAKTIFWLFPLASILIAPSLKKDPYWQPLFVYTIVAALISVFLMLASIWLPEESSWFGLFERILVADEIIWVEIMGIKMFKFSLHNR